ncbi:MAG: thiolase family protein [Candidatus Nitrosotenuis sp.]|nr:MAG: thiolase family protein [Candidatus Nitrosotenuis sp.]
MNRVAVVGYSDTKFSSDDIPIESSMFAAVKILFEQTPNLSQGDIDAVLTSTNDNKKYLSPIVSEMSGIAPKISHNVENLCNSGTNATVSAFSYIASGLADVALVVGAERFDSPGQVLQWDDSRGEFKHPIFWASMFTKAHKRKFGTTDEHLAYVSAKNHRNALDNPTAYSPKEYTIEEIMNSKKLTDDLRLLDCSRPCTGSSAILLASEKTAKKFTDIPVWISGIGQKTTSASFTKNDLTSVESTRLAANDAFLMSKTSPQKIDVAEIHDAFTICELMVLEDMGFVQKGNAGQFVLDLYNTNDKKINPRGGLIGAGHPLGATGIAQVSEITKQLQGKSGKRQIENPKIGLVQNMSAAATSSTVLVLES